MLSVKRPTSTTVQYAVSTRAPVTTLATRGSDYLILLARVLGGTLVAALLFHQYRVTLPDDHSAASDVERAFLATPLSQCAALITMHSNLLGRIVLCSIISWFIFRKGYTEESLLVIRGLGVQTSTNSPSYLWTSTTRFIPTSSIQDIFIHEAFKGFEVRFYLSIVVEGEGDAVVVFPVRINVPSS